jgi:hypothetical protein
MLTKTLVSDMLLELARREKFAGIKPDEDLDIFMKVLIICKFVPASFSCLIICC